MKSSDYGKILLLAGALALAACDKNPSFSGVGVTHGPGAGGGGGGGIGGGGPGGAIEPRMAFGPEQLSGIGGLKLAGNASRVVFTDDSDPLGTNPDDNWQLFSFNLQTNDLVQITDGSQTAIPAIFDFDLTDNGSDVVWVSTNDFTGDNPNNSFNVFMARTDGSGIRQVTRINPGVAFNPVVSGDGSIVAFRSFSDLTGDNAAGDDHIFTINADGSNLTQITNQQLFPDELAFADNGLKIAFHGRGDPFGTNADGSEEVFVIDVDGNNLTQLTAGDGDSMAPKISDNGGVVMYASRADLVPGGNADLNYEVYTSPSDGSGITQITNSDDDSGVFEGGSPGAYEIDANGSFIVFTSDSDLTGENSNGSHTIYWAAASGGQVFQLLREGTVPNPNGSISATKPSMTNNSDGIAFISGANLTSFTQPGFDKIYTTLRQ